MEKKKMKLSAKILITIVILLIITFILGYVFIRNRLTIRGVVIKSNEKNILIMDVKDESPLYIGLPENVNLHFKEGQEIIVYLEYNTVIIETYPGSIDSQFIKDVKIRKEKSNVQVPEEILQGKPRKQ